MTSTQFPWLNKPSASVVISSPLQGKRIFLYEIMFYCLIRRKPVLLITTDHSVEDIKKELIGNKYYYGAYEKEKLLQFIDCFAYNSGKSMKDTETIKRVAGPLALTEISVALSEVERDFFKKSKEHVVIFDSLSTLLMYSNPQAIGRFIQVIIAKIKNAGGVVFFTLERGMHDEKVLVTIEHIMDSIIEIKKSKGAISYKSAGIKGYDRWTKI